MAIVITSCKLIIALTNIVLHLTSTYEVVDTVANVYNRLVMFDSKSIHAATGYFGDAIENARFFHLFFFDVEW